MSTHRHRNQLYNRGDNRPNNLQTSQPSNHHKDLRASPQNSPAANLLNHPDSRRFNHLCIHRSSPVANPLNHPHSLRINHPFNQLFNLQLRPRDCQRNSLSIVRHLIQARNHQRHLPFSRLTNHLAPLQSNLHSIHPLSHRGNRADGLRLSLLTFHQLSHHPNLRSQRASLPINHGLILLGSLLVSQRLLQLPSHLVSLSKDPHRNHPNILPDVLLTVHRVALRSNLHTSRQINLPSNPSSAHLVSHLIYLQESLPRNRRINRRENHHNNPY